MDSRKEIRYKSRFTPKVFSKLSEDEQNSVLREMYGNNFERIGKLILITGIPEEYNVRVNTLGEPDRKSPIGQMGYIDN